MFLSRYPLLSHIPYDQWIRKYAFSSKFSASTNAIIESNLLSGELISRTNKETGRQTVNAIQSTSDVFGSKLDTFALTYLFDSLMTVGAIAVSTLVLSKKLDNVTYGIERLGTLFTEGFSLLSSKLDIQSDHLVEIKDQLFKISETLKSPSITKATEWRNIALERLGSSLYPEAIEAFDKAIQLDSTDPISNLMMGKIYLDAVDTEISHHNPDRAIEYFSKAARYAAASITKVPKLKEIQGEAIYLKTSALLAKMVQMRINGRDETEINECLQIALETIEQLRKLSPEHLQSLYLKIKILLILGNKNEAELEFNHLLDKDMNFLYTAARDDDFNRLSQIGVAILDNYEPKFRDLLERAANQFFDIYERINKFEFVFPASMKEWLTKEKLNNRKSAIKTFSSKTYRELINSEAPVLEILIFSFNEMKKYESLLFKNIRLLISEKIKALMHTYPCINWEFVDPIWIKNKNLDKNKKIDSFLVKIPETFNSSNELRRWELEIGSLQTELSFIKDKSGELESSYLYAVNIFKNNGIYVNKAKRVFKSTMKGCSYGFLVFFGGLLLSMILYEITKDFPITLFIISLIFACIVSVIATNSCYKMKSEKRRQVKYFEDNARKLGVTESFIQSLAHKLANDQRLNI